MPQRSHGLDELVTCIIHPPPIPAVESFIRAHVERLPGRIIELTLPTFYNPLNRSKLLSVFQRGLRRARLELGFGTGDSQRLARFLKIKKVNVVLSEYGPTAVSCLNACRLSGVPLVPIFHGYDAFVRNLIPNNLKDYHRLFRECPAIIAVSRAMVEQLVATGAPREKLHYIPCGVDTEIFSEINPAENTERFIAVGRFVEKKAPFLTILAFNRVLQECPAATLTMAGDGPLLDTCIILVSSLGIERSVQLLGKMPHNKVADLMAKARAFLQHSVQAPNGDCEGTPVAILEAAGRGLPVISTWHAGIPDVVQHEQTGFLVEEHDFKGMAQYMIKIAKNPEIARRMGEKAAELVREYYNISMSIERLANLLNKVARK